MTAMSNANFADWLRQNGGSVDANGNVSSNIKWVDQKKTIKGSLNKDTGETTPDREEVTRVFTAPNGATLALKRIASGSDADLATRGPNGTQGASYEVVSQSPPTAAKPSAASQSTNVTTVSDTTPGIFILRPGETKPTWVPNPGYKGAKKTVQSVSGTDKDSKNMTITYTDGSQDVQSNPAYKASPDKYVQGQNGEPDHVEHVNDDGSLTIWPVPIIAGPDTSTAPDAEFTPMHVVEDLKAYAKWLDGERAAGRITVAQQQKLWDTRKALADAYIQEQKLAQDQSNKLRDQDITQRNQDLQLDESRVTAAQTNLKNALDNASEVNKYLKPGSNLGGKLLLGNLVMGQTMAKAYGGMTDHPQVPVGGNPQVPASLQSAIGNPNVASAPAAAAMAPPQQQPQSASVPGQVATPPNDGTISETPEQIQARANAANIQAPAVGGGSPVHITFNVGGQTGVGSPTGDGQAPITPGQNGAPAMPAQAPVVPAAVAQSADNAVAGAPQPAQMSGSPVDTNFMPATTASAQNIPSSSGAGIDMSGINFPPQWWSQQMADIGFDPEAVKQGFGNFLGAGSAPQDEQPYGSG